MTQDMNHTFRKALRAVLAAAMMSLTGSHALAQEPSSSTSTGVVVNGNVFGGGNLAEVKGRVTVNIKAGTVVNDVYGGGAKAHTNTANWDPEADGYVEATGLTAGLSPVKGLYTKSENTYTQITDDDAKAEADTKYYIKGAWANATDKSAVYTTQVKLTGGTIGNVYGGGLGDAANPAYVWGNVLVDLNGTTTYDTDGKVETTPITTKGCIVTNVFGCNNVNGTPKGEVLVHVHATQSSAEGKTIVSAKTDKNTNTYDVEAVYGGGNQAEYYPLNAMSDDETTKASAHTNVIIDGCTQTSIKNVYGGGNAASTPSTSVTINGAYEINEVFGGGNGFGDGNPGANVGFHDYSAVESTFPTKTERQTTDFTSTYVYGSGKASVNIFGGTVHRVFGGSNTKGNVRITAITMLEDKNGCEFHMDEAYGGGKSAPMDAEAKLHIACIPGLRAAYGGAEAADVLGDVTLNITNGTYDRVFGGNNLSGTISGSITVNIEETGCKPIIIGELYGGGNQAAYSVFGYKKSGTTNVIRTSKDDGTAFYTPSTPYSSNQLFADPQVNVKSFTSIGKVYGGGLGTTATMVGNPTVNVNVAEGAHKTTVIDDNAKTYSDDNGKPVPSHESGKIGAINDVYGGGNAAEVVGNTIVNIGTDEYVFVTKEFAVGASVANYYIRTGAGTAASPYTYTSASGTATENTTYYERKNVVGADIRGNVYGGGEGAATTVTGNVQVNVGSKDYTGNMSVAIWGNVYGGSALGSVNTDTNNTTLVNLFKGTINGNVFGGGLGQAAVAAKYTAVGSGTTLTSGKTYYTSDAGDGAFVSNGTEVANGTNYYEMTTEPVDAVAASVKGKVRVDLNGYDGIVTNTSATDYDEDAFGSCIVKGSIFGCNDTNGSPEGDVEVHIYKTIGWTDDKGTADTDDDVSHVRTADVENTTEANRTYELTSVFGGGNKATYSASDKTAKVIIETCDVSIQEVYGGGYGADVPNTQVEVKGAYEIGTVFGGGYGAGSDDPTAADYNPGANVSGSTDVILKGGVVHEVYGGSNTKGNIVVGSNVNVSDGSGCCDLKVDNIYGGGKNASMEGGTSIVLGCQPNTWIEDIYAGSREADVDGNVKLTITSGMFKRVFGGNKTSGKLKGSITVNIEETGSCSTPIIIGELYAGGNEADYSIYGYKDNGDPMTADDLRTKLITDNPGMTTEEIDALFQTTKKANPQLNVLAFTSIGAVYGGGYSAKMYADPTVSINVVKGSHYNDDALAAGSTPALAGVTPATTLPYPAHAKGAIGAIGNVFGGGNLANVYGSTTVNIGTETTVGFVTEPVHLRTDPETPLSKTNGLYVVPVEGAIITENVYGGGNQADVTGDTQVNICVKKNDSNVYENVAPGTAGVSIGGDVFGAGKGLNTDVETALVEGNGIVKMGGGSVAKSVYGGGELSQVGGDTDITVSGGTIGTENLGGSLYGNIYGGGFGSLDDVRFGLIKGNTNVAISNGTILHNVYGGGAYGSVGDFNYDENGNITSIKTDAQNKVTTGKAVIYITGGTIGTTGKENGMIFGSSRGDVGNPNSIHNKLAWVYDTHVAVGDTTKTGSDIVTTTPLIKGSIYGGGENGHNFHSSYVRINGGTIGIHDTDDDVTYKDDKEEVDKVTYQGKDYNYPYRGNVYGGGCGTDKYYSNTTGVTNPNDGNGDTYNSLAGIVQGDATVRITGGTIIHNVYGAGAMGSVGITTGTTSGGKTTISIGGGTIGVSGIGGNGNVFGAARGDKDDTAIGLAQVRETSVTVSAGQVMGNVYGGGEVGNVGLFSNQSPVSVGNYIWDTSNTGNGLCTVTVSGGKIGPDDVALSKEHGNVFGGGKGVSNTFECEKAMVYKTNVTVSGGSTVNGTVYGGGEVGRVEGNTVVTIGTENETDEPEIKGNVFAAGAGTKTHGYSALVRGTSSVTVQGKAKVFKNVYGGGEEASVGRYKVKVKNDPLTPSDAPSTLPVGMPYQLISGGTSTVVIQDNAVIGTDGVTTTGHVYGAGQGVDPHEVDYTYQDNDTKPSRMVSGNTWEYFADEPAFLQFVETLALTGTTDVTIGEGATVRGSVFGGSESGFVYHNTKVEIQGGTVNGDAFGGGRGLATFAEAGRVSGNTEIGVSGGAVKGNVYGGGNLGDVGTIKKNTTNYNYTWKNSDSNGNVNATGNDNTSGNNKLTGENKNTGICKVTISGGIIGIDNPTDKTEQGNVFGAGEGLANTWWCEKAIAYATDVSVTKGTVYGNVYGGGEVGRVEDDAKVTIGALNGTDVFEIKGSVFGAGAGLATHGYSALVRGNAEVTVQGKAQVGGSVYGGGEIASVGRFHVIGGLPKNPQAGGTCTVKIQGNAKIGTSGTGHNVFGACKGVTPAYNNTQGNANRSKSMQLEANRPKVKDPETGEDTETVKAEHEFWDYCETYPEGYTGNKFVWVYYETEDDYLDFLKTLALTSNTHVTVGGSSDVYGSVFGGGERGITLGGVDVNMTGGTVYEDVYGGGSLADSNTAMWDAENQTLHDYAVLELIPGLSHVTGYYKGEELVTDPNAVAGEGEANSYSAIYKTNVNLTGGTIKGNAYGGGLGRKASTGVTAVEAMVYGDVQVELNNNNEGGPADRTKTGCAVNRVFGCNNLNGTPKGKVKVHVYATQKDADGAKISDKTLGSYDVDAVYGGGNLSPYKPVDAYSTDETTLNAARTQVIIDGCELTSIRQVYGGGNAASVPATFVEINGTYEIDEVFGGGNGADNYSLNEGGTDVWYQNPGANVGYFNYTNTVASGTSPGTITNPYYLAPDDEAFDTKDERLADNTEAAALRYGSGIARLEVYGGTIHTSYGGSNSRGNVRTSLSSVYSANGGCPMAVGTSYGGGKNAESDGKVDMVADCAHGIKEMFGGSMNADVDNDINLRITNGSTLERVFGGNNTSGAVNGSITVTIEEGGCEPIKIGHLYLGGFLAPYSVYGYETNADGSYKTEPVKYIDANGAEQTLNQRIPLESGSKRKADPCLYVISATRIDSIFGGGYQAKLIGNPRVNINMKQGKVLLTRTGTEGSYVYTDAMGVEYKNITPETTGEGESAVTKYYATLPLGKIGTVYGGGNMADVVGDTYVEIGTGTCVKFVTDDEGNVTEEVETLDRNGANITGNVFGGGKGKADSFTCEKAMVGVVDKGFGSTHVIIGNGTVGALDEDGKLVEGTGNVYGGGEIGRVELNTTVTIGKEGDEASAPEIRGYVFGGGKGLETHGYSALVRGNPAVTIQGGAKIGKSVYGGGEIASVGNFFVKGVTYPAELNAPTPPENIPDGMPYALKLENSGKCTVIVRDKAEIGPDNMKMEKRDEQNNLLRPDDKGHVFGAGKGILPYEATNDPKRMNKNSEWESYANNESGYITFIETLGMTASTDVTITDNAFVKGSVYGGSENGHVLHNTKVTIAEKCQIGNGDGVNRRYTDDEWNSESLAECASWPFGKQTGTDTNNKPIMKYLPYDVYDYVDPTAANPVPKAASDGHTYYGNVFGGGSGIFPYKKKAGWLKNDAKSAEVGQPVDKDGYSDGVWLRSAGAVYGNTEVNIIGGHILTSVYGGNECTDVTGTSTVKMSGGTLGVPRTEQQMKDHPVTCYLFGAGKGDQRINFNTWTNIASVNVDITGGRIFGSVFGGGEDGHVLGDVTMSISEADANKPTKIGTTGTSYVDGNVFGGGRGFSGDAQTAGTVGGNVNLNISGGTMLGSVYGGGRLASVGTMFEFPTLDDGNPNPEYGQFKEDGNGKTYGHVTIYITGGIIGNTVGNRESGNVFGGSMGRLELLNGTRNPIWPKMAQVKSATVNISGDNTVIRRSVYGGGELGTVRDDAEVTISGGTVRRDVYGGGYGSEDMKYTVFSVKEPNGTNGYVDNTYAYTPMQFAGCVGKSTTVNISGGYIRKSVYGGGEMASVGVINYRAAEATSEIAADKVKIGPIDGKTYYYENMVKHGDATKEFALSWPYEFEYVPGYNGATHVNITGGRLGLKDSDEDNTDIKADNGDVYGAGKGKAGDYKDYLFCANVGSTDVKIAYTTTPEAYSSDGDLIAGAVYGGGEDGHVMGDTKLTMSGGLVYHSLYGAGSGKGKFPATLKKIGKEETYDTNIYSITAGKVFGNSTVEMSGGYVVRNVYGGGNMGSVGKGNYAGGADDYSTTGYGEKVDGNLWDGSNKFSTAFLNSGKCTVNITGGTIGYIDSSEPSNSMYPWNSTASLPYGNVFGGCRGESAPNISETPRYLYSPEFFVGYANETEVTIGGNTKILGSVYGGGMDGHVRRDAHVIINGGEIGLPFTDANKGILGTDPNDIQWLARGNVYGSGSGIGQYKYDFDYDGEYTSTVTYNGKQTKEEDFSTSAGSVTRFTTVDINGGTIHRNVYGGGSLSSIGAPKIPVDDVVPPDPYLPTDPQHSSEVGKQSLNQVTIAGGQIGNADDFAKGYGGNVFGASRGDATIADPSSFATSVWTDVDVTGGTIAGDVYGGGEVGTVKQSTDIDLTGGIISHDVFGGGRGTSSVAADVGGDASVDLNNVAADTKGCVVKGSVYGANNINGTPKGHVLVHVFGTQNENTGAINAKVDGKYDVTAVFGGGKSADYVPTDTKQSTEVIIEGCNLTSIQEVYGGGYGASTPGTNVLINGTKIIDKLFGGGYGDSETNNHTDPTAPNYNPGANVGYRTDGTPYGLYLDENPPKTKIAIVQLKAGKVNSVFGGSNSLGDIRNGASITTLTADDTGSETTDPCEILEVGELYGGGNEAVMEGGAEIVLRCMPDSWIGEVYAGARKADVGNDVSLTITSGKFEHVYGGNKSDGKIDGYVEVNIEECPTCGTPVIIGELYGGGNEAPYKLPESYGKDYQSPRVNVRAFTSIGTIYGGGKGEEAVVNGNPTVSINVGMVDGGGQDYAGETRSGVKLYPHEKNKIGVIGNVFGGGNAAKVEGNTNVFIGTESYVQLDRIVAGETNVDNYYTRSGDGTDVSPYVYTKASGKALENTIYYLPVLGVDIQGNVYGGGNAAEVTGKTNVVIGKKASE